MTERLENDIIKEIKGSGLKGEVHLKPIKVNVKELSFDDEHINKERMRKITREMTEGYINNASISVTVWNGEFENYIGNDGAAYVDVKNKLIRTAFSREDYDDVYEKIMEVLKKYGR